MRVVDTSLWIEYLSDGALADKAERCILPFATCVVPSMVQYELAKWAARTLSNDEAKPVLSYLTECHPAIMDSIVATRAAFLSIEHKLHATDAIIYATARVLEVDLFTCDSHFKDLPGVKYFEKKL